jgi:hypothetical protein
MKLNLVNLNYYFDIVLYLLYAKRDEKVHKDKLWNTIYHIGKNNSQTGLRIFEDYKSKHGYKAKQVSFCSKGYAISAIDKMIKWKLIEFKEESNRHLLNLSTKGITLARFLIDIDDYQKNYYGLVQAIEAKVPWIHKSSLNKLRYHDSHWPAIEIDFYYDYWSNMKDFRTLIDNHFMNIVILRCSKIMDDPFFSYRKEVTEILNEIIIKVMVNKYNFSLTNYKKYQKYEEVRNTENYQTPIKQQPRFEEKTDSGEEGKAPFYSEMSKFFKFKIVPSILEEVIKEMTLSYLKLLEYPDDYVAGGLENYLKNKEDIIEQYIKKNEKRETYEDMEYDYRGLINLRYNTYKIFLEILKEHSNQLKRI